MNIVIVLEGVPCDSHKSETDSMAFADGVDPGIRKLAV